MRLALRRVLWVLALPVMAILYVTTVFPVIAVLVGFFIVDERVGLPEIVRGLWFIGPWPEKVVSR